MTSAKAPANSPRDIARWIMGTSTSRLVASWLTLGLFLYLTSWSVWTLLCLADLVQLSLRGEKLALRSALLLIESALRATALVTPASLSTRLQDGAANLASTRQRLRPDPGKP